VINSHTNSFNCGSILGGSILKVIPVIDLLGGVVVHAKKGERATYQAIQSQLTPSSQPLDIVAALLAVYPFEQLYIADLNAIQKLNGNDENNYSVIAAIKQLYPKLELWVDAGISNNTELNSWQKLNVRLIIGSENFAKIGNFASLNIANKDFILSLDFMPSGYQGPAELLANTEYWPQDVILMSLLNVGSNNGTNVKLMRDFIARAKGFNLIAAGGIRNIDDLITLKNMGANVALMATALHQKQISTKQLETIAQ
jgi:phosphoribosylformimino-5-aminoimidazole carboxamide ribotide isomerase